jgi:formimidoylglutamate deiminase
MLKAGYTAVAEFHYLHRQIHGAPYGKTNALWEAVGEAANIAGIGLTFLPTLYQCADFGGAPLTMEQARFALHEDEFLRMIEDRVSADRRRGSGTQRTGAAFHSLRAVPMDTVHKVARGLAAINPSLPVHIHVAEQLREVQACRKATGRRPVELLLDSGVLTPHWCLVHATHATPAELKAFP